MTEQTDHPNLEQARETFAQRVAVAYERTWHGYGFTDPNYTYERALELGRQMAKHAFPDVPATLILTLSVDVQAAIEEIVKRNPQMGTLTRMAIDAGDGVVGD